MKKDAYAWLRPDDWQTVIKNKSPFPPEILAHLQTRNRELDEFLTGTESLQKTIRQEILSRSHKSFEYEYIFDEKKYQLKKDKEDSYPRLQLWKKEKWITIFDLAEEAKKHSYFKIGQFDFSAEGKYFLFSYDRKGNESFRIAAFNVATGELTKIESRSTSGSFVCHPKEQIFYYVRLNRNFRPQYVYQHTINERAIWDKEIFAEKYFRHNLKIYLLQDNHTLVIDSNDEKTSVIHLYDLRKQKCVKFKSHKKGELIKKIAYKNNCYYVLNNIGQTHNFCISYTPTNNLARQLWCLETPERTHSILLDFIIRGQYMALLYLSNARHYLRIVNLETRESYFVKMQKKAFVLSFDSSPVKTVKNSDILFTFSSLDTPPVKMKLHPPNHDFMSLAAPDVNVPYQLHRIYARRRGQPPVPITLLHHNNVKPDIKNPPPLFVTAYGAYGHFYDIFYDKEILSLVDRGFVYAIIHVRGGTEKGYGWYKAGRMYGKKNTFRDFLSGIETLIDRGFAKKGNIVGCGYSAGGMIVGYMANNHPDLFKLLIADLPFVDVLNTTMDKTLPLTPLEWAEWGNPITSPKAYKYIQSYCPYQNIQAQKYPNILATAGLYDPRVMYWEPAKWVEKLKSANRANTRIDLSANMKAGHFGAAKLARVSADTAKLYAYILRIFDMENIKPW